MKPSLAVGLLALPFAAVPAASQPEAQPAPQLVVAISVDQLSADLFAQYRQHFTGGLARLARGVVFPAGYQSHAATETCPGHSTILTGSRPARTGIIGNNWFDLGASREDKYIYCAEDERVEGSTSDDYTVSPAHLRVPTLGDLMRRADPRSRVVAVAGKDRAAIMMGGHAPNQRWYRRGTAFVSDLGIAPSPAVARVNAEAAAALATARDAAPLPAICEPRARPVPIGGGGEPVGAHRFARAAGDGGAFVASPEYDSIVLALAAALRDEMDLGEGEATDLLTIGLSATDYVGHRYGTQGAEMCIQLLALDRLLGQFFERLDATGIDYVAMLTADHGGLDIPERANQEAIPEARRVDEALSVRNVDQALRERFSFDRQILFGEYVSGDMYVDRALPPELRQRVVAEAVRTFRAHPEVAAVFTREELAAAPQPSGPPDIWSLIERARASFDPERSGDFLVLLKPRITPISDTSGGYASTHGSPWDYDRRVPILFWRRTLPPFEQPLAVETVDILPTLAALIGLAIPPETIDGRCLDLVDGPETSCPTR